MALLDVLKERTERRTSTAQVSCGELGLLTVEALPPAELARLQSDRAVLYAACRELQSAGESLRKAGKLFAPDEVTAYLSDEEAASGAAAVREISGVSASRRDFSTGTDTASGDQDESASLTESGEIRLDAVQEENHVYSETRHARKSESLRVRPDSVQENGEIQTSVGPDFAEIRLSSVQGEAEVPPPDSGAKSLKTGRGQDSREFSDREARTRETDKKSRDIVDLPGARTPNLGQNPVRSEHSKAAAAHEAKSEIPEKLHETTSEQGDLKGAALHEITSESAGSGTGLPHEMKSELRETLHENESEIHPAMWEGLHETTSEQTAFRAGGLHEMESDFAAVALEKTHGTMGKNREPVHESKSDLQRTIQKNALKIPEEMHETTSEFGRNAPGPMHEIRSEVRDILHEMESELTDRVARGLLDGLRRAAAVR